MASLHQQLAQLEQRVRELQHALERERELKIQAQRAATAAEESARRAWRTIAQTTNRSPKQDSRVQ